MLFKQHHLPQQAIVVSTQFDEGRPHGPEAAWTGLSGMLFVHSLLSVLWLSTGSLHGIRSCGGRHGLGSHFGLLGLLVFSL